MTAPTGGAWTPGPWRAGRSGTVVCDTPIQEIGGSDSVNYYGGHLVAESVAPQNVAIIAAAPDLLEACKAVQTANDAYSGGAPFLECVKLDERANQLVRAALAKAKGEKQ